MRIQEFLDHCAASERWVRDFYAFLADSFAENPRGSAIFRELAEEEEAHARSFEFLKPIAARVALDVIVLDHFSVDLERMRTGLGKVRQMVESRKGSSLLEVLGMAILVESTTMERDKLAFARVEDPDFQNIVKGIVHCDDDHRNKLEAMRDNLIVAA